MDKIMGVVRHVVGMVGAVLVALGIAEADQMATVTESLTVIGGAVLSLAAIGASIYAKVKSFKLFGGE